MSEGRSGGTIRDHLENRRQGVAFIERMVAAWRDGDALSGAPHAGGEGTVVVVGSTMPIFAGDVANNRHGQLDGARDTVIIFGPSIEIQRDPA